MSPRRRVTRKFTTKGHHRYESIEEFLERPFSDGLHSIKTNNRWFDFVHENNSAEVTLVSFSAATPNKVETYPRFSGRNIANALGTNWLAFSDPAIGSAESLSTFWHLGTRRVASRKFIPAIVKRLQNEQPNQNLLFFGSSAGGFAALNYGSQFPGSASFVMNPRINITAAPRVFTKYAPVAYRGFSLDKLERDLPLNMAWKYRTPQGNRVIYLQNLEDSTYVKNHYTPFKRAVLGREDVLFITGNWGDGHVVPPKDSYMKPLSELVSSAPDWTLADYAGPTYNQTY